MFGVGGLGCCESGCAGSVWSSTSHTSWRKYTLGLFDYLPQYIESWTAESTAWIVAACRSCCVLVQQSYQWVAQLLHRSNCGGCHASCWSLHSWCWGGTPLHSTVAHEFSPHSVSNGFSCSAVGVGVVLRQWPWVYDLCHTFLHAEQVKKPTAMRESHAILAWQ